MVEGETSLRYITPSLLEVSGSFTLAVLSLVIDWDHYVFDGEFSHTVAYICDIITIVLSHYLLYCIVLYCISFAVKSESAYIASMYVKVLSYAI